MGSGKSRKPTEEPARPRRRGRKTKEPLPEVVQPVELPAVEEQHTEMRAEESRTDELPAEPLATEPAPEVGPAPPAPDFPAQSPELAAAEAELVRKVAGIKPGSLRPGAAEGWGNKRVVTIVCSACRVNPRVVATSDLFHVNMCEECAKAAKTAARKAKSQSKTN
jgi:hypothetical protein